jgi:hypothetical protein
MSILVGPVILSATGGSISTIAGYTIHTFSTPGTSTFVPTGTGFIEVLVVGGGGGSSTNANWGGGGGGAVIYNKLANVTSGTSYPITVGNGLGGISSCTFNNATMIAFGGGGGDGGSSPNSSGGGGSVYSGNPGGTGAGVTGLGFPGASHPAGGGGGGAGGAGGFGGGIGVSYSISGTSQYYGGGGAGGGGGSPNGGLTPASYGTGGGLPGTPGAVIIRYRKV